MLAQLATDEKSNEITAIPLLLKQLALGGCIVTIDAMGTQTKIAEQIIEQEGEYALALKDNHGNLYDEVKATFALAEKEGFASQHWESDRQVEKGHGRLEIREDAGEDAEAFMAMTNLIEQACNQYLQTGTFPTTYESLQPVPVLSAGHLTFAGDDGMRKGQTYRARIETIHFCDLETRQEHDQASLWLKLRTPDEQGKWAWGIWSEAIPLPSTVCTYLAQGATTQAPTLREIRGDDGSRVAVLDLMLEVPAKYVSPLAQGTVATGRLVARAMRDGCDEGRGTWEGKAPISWGAVLVEEVPTSLRFSVSKRYWA